MLHLGNNLGTRFLKYLFTFSHVTFSKSSDRNKMLGLLRLGALLTDLGPVGKMRDVHSLVIMRTERVTALLLNDATAETVVWLPFTLCFNTIRLETAMRETRIFMFRICFFLVRNRYEAKKSGRDPNPETSKKKKTMVFTSQRSIRFLNTALLLIFSIKNYESTALDCQGTHPLENVFCYVRMDANDINACEEMTRIISHIDIVKDVYHFLK
jgi:hypothetical protein